MIQPRSVFVLSNLLQILSRVSVLFLYYLLILFFHFKYINEETKGFRISAMKRRYLYKKGCMQLNIKIPIINTRFSAMHNFAIDYPMQRLITFSLMQTNEYVNSYYIKLLMENKTK